MQDEDVFSFEDSFGIASSSENIEKMEIIDTIEALTAVENFLPNALNLLEAALQDYQEFWQTEEPYF